MNDTPVIEPPTTTQLAKAVARIKFPGSTLTRAVHLALPVDAVCGIDARHSAAGWLYRGEVQPALKDPFETAAALASVGHRPGDHYLNLTRPPATWVKPLRSGARTLVFGADLVLPVPPIAADCDLSARRVAAFLSTVATAGPLEPPTVLETKAGPLLLDGTDAAWVLRSTDRADEPPQPLAAVTAKDLACELEHALGATSHEIVALPPRFPGTTDIEVLLDRPDGWQVIVPATLSPGSEVLGVSASDMLVEDLGPVPEGFEAIGTSRWEDAAVALHPSGVTCLVRRLV
jgi:hypothetical protein